ncbi:DeoR/GlpR family DNA-binding transcription regulator [Streptomyces sp. NPDC005336]|uniref:DeoR/GlpR family DNA-binding transcription regulator n=1 Tax=unclassified Streptomyces TaxID=2593676 RepID=UPI0033AB52B5
MSSSRNGSRQASGVGVQPNVQRRERIREQVLATGFARIENLAEEFSVSVMTIHRDLDVLAEQGWLRKIRGGATAHPSALLDTSARSRLSAMVAEKQQIARAALGHVSRGQTVIIDDSTTALQLAQLLPAQGPMTVISNYLAVVNALAGEAGIELIALGGAYYPAYDAFLGLQTREAIRPLRADVLFMSTTAISDGSCFHKSQDTIMIKRALMEAAERRVLLLDHTKLGKRALRQLAPLTAFDIVIVDAAIGPEDLAELRGWGVPVEVAPPTP